jgi:hypothetical protein
LLQACDQAPKLRELSRYGGGHHFRLQASPHVRDVISQAMSEIGGFAIDQALTVKKADPA